MQSVDLFTGDTKEDKAIDFLREHEPEEGYFLGFSGGKDSVVMEHLAKLSGVKYQSYYSATGIDPPEVVRFIRDNYPEVIFKRPHFRMPRKLPEWPGTHGFFGMIPKKGFPTKHARWCCDKLKKDPTKDVPLRHRLIGLRAEESAKRAKRPQIEPYQKQTIYKPIFSWLEWEIWDHIEGYDLPYCCLYDEGFSRIGCVVCPLICGKARSDQVKVQIHKDRWPKYYVAFEKAMRKLWDDREWRRKRKYSYSLTFEEFLENWYHGNRNVNSGKQLHLFEGLK